jgi:hypothetical protein
MMSVPYSLEVNDIPMCVGKSQSGEEFCQMIIDQFDQLTRTASSQVGSWRSVSILSSAISSNAKNTSSGHSNTSRAITAYG